jgi:HAMP domain-containing protein
MSARTLNPDKEREMTQEQYSPQVQNLARPLRAGWRRIGLKWKIVGGLVSGVILFGLVVLAVVNHQMDRALRSQLDRRASDIATALGDASATHILRKNVLELYTLVTKYSLLTGVAYTFISDGKGEIMAHSLGAFPQELREPLSSSSQREAHQREFVFRGRKVHETRVPIHEGQVGVVYVGIWGDSIEGEIQRALLPLIGLIAIALAASVVFSVLVTQGIVGRVLRLKEIADKVSLGDLETPVRIESNDEIGDLARSLERMRSSLKAAMARLGT